MSRLFQLGDDSLRNLLSWLDFRSICYLDIAVGNVDERLLWLHNLQRIDSRAVDESEHSDSSIRWLITRGARTTMIRIRRNRNDFITDETFAGIGIHFVPTVRRSKTLVSILLNALRRVFRLNLRNCNITNGADIGIYFRIHGCHHLKCIDLSGCHMVTDIGASSIAHGCCHLTTINLSNCNGISDIGVSALAQGCPHLTKINLSRCFFLTDVSLSAIAEGCRDLTAINLSDCRRSTSDIGLSALAQGCPHLTDINLSDCHSISDGICAIAQGCPHLTTINLSGCGSISDIGVCAIAQGCPD